MCKQEETDRLPLHAGPCVQDSPQLPVIDNSSGALQDWPGGPNMRSMTHNANAILIFMPGAPEITCLVRLLESSSRLRQAAQGQVKVLPLHGALPSHAQVHYS